jgi:hypothetical protein
VSLGVLALGKLVLLLFSFTHMLPDLALAPVDDLSVNLEEGPGTDEHCVAWRQSSSPLLNSTACRRWATATYILRWWVVSKASCW